MKQAEASYRTAGVEGLTYYAAQANPMPARPRLTGTHRCDVCIVGGGFTGLSTALHLASRGYEAVVLEAERIGAGASGRNSGFVLPGYAMDIDELCAVLGELHAERAWRLSVEAVGLVANLVARHGIACDLKPGALTAAAAPTDVDTLAEQARLMRGFGYGRIELLDRAAVRGIVSSPNYFGGLLDMGALHLDPLHYAHGLARAALVAGASIHEDSAVVRIEQGEHLRAVTAQGVVEARYVVLAANAYLGALAPRIARRIVPVTALIGATASLGADTARRLLKRDVAVFDTQPALDYYRLTSDHRLIFGSATRFIRPSAARSAAWLERQLARVFPQIATPRMEYVWRGQVDLTRNRLPDLGREGDVWYAQGFNGHGVALTTLAGRAIADAIAGHDEDWATLASLPYRPWPGGAALSGALLPFVRGFMQLRHAVARRLAR
ncbi:MAG TPA: FAD-binding oxidoreductase [Alphaproteobacteria bacterium]|nr:FAD-binding oxidoreductase [Alphaproteobacteria bacterium]